jgi:hypothetical protein
MDSMIDKCELYDIDRAVIETLAKAGIQPTEPMVHFKYGKLSGTDWYGPLFECQSEEKGKHLTLISAFSPSNFWDGTSAAPTSSGIVYFKSQGKVADEGGQILLGYDEIQMAGRFEDNWDLTTEINEELEHARQRNNNGQLETKTVDGKVVSFTALGIAEDRVRQYANLITALYIDEAVKTLAKDFGELSF